MTINSLLDRLLQGEPAYGMFCVIPSSISAEFVAAVGWDYVAVDLQHGVVGYSEAVRMFQAIGCAGTLPMARVSGNHAAEIQKILDAGAMGVIVPLVETADDAERAVRSCRYPPRGERSFGPVRAALTVGSRDVAALEQVACFVMVETQRGLANLDEIAGVPGLDGIYIGPTDLALALEVAPAYEPQAAAHVDAVERIRATCLAHGLIAAIHCDSPECAARRRAQGFQMVTVGNEATHMARTIAEHHRAVHEIAE